MEYNGEEVNVPAGDGISLGTGVFESAGAMGGAQELINIRDKIIGITNFFMNSPGDLPAVENAAICVHKLIWVEFETSEQRFILKDKNLVVSHIE